MRIAVISGSWLAQECGVGHYASVLFKHLEAKGADVLKVTFSPNQHLRGILKIANALSRFRPDIINLQYPTFGYERSILPLLLPLLYRRRLILTLHEFSGYNLASRYKFIVAALFCKHIIFVADYERAAFVRLFPFTEDRTSVIHIGSNIPKAAGVKPCRERLLCYFGLIFPGKGLSEYIECARRILLSSPTAKVSIIGSVPVRYAGYGEKILKDAVDHGIEVFVGESDERVAELLSEHQFGYLPFSDGASEKRGSLLAMLSNGLQVLTTYSDVTPQYMKDVTIPVNDYREAHDYIMSHQNDNRNSVEISFPKQHEWCAIAAKQLELYIATMKQSCDEKPTGAVKCCVANDLGDFSDLWPRTDRFGHAHCYAFQCADLLQVWCNTVGKARRVQTYFVAIFDDMGRPILLLPLGIERWHGIRILSFLDGGVSDYNVPVVFEPNRAWDRDSAARLWEELLKVLPPFDVAILHKMPVDINGVPNPLIHLGVTPFHAAGYLTQLTGKWEEYAAKQLPRKRRLREKRRSLAKLGEVAFVIAADLADRRRIAEAMIDQKTRRLVETTGADGSDHPGQKQYYLNMTEHMTSPKPLLIAALELDGKVLAALWGFVVGGRCYYMAPSFEGGEWKRFSPGRLLLEDLLKWSFSNGITVFDFGLGDQSYKLEYSNEMLPLYQWVTSRTWIGSAYATALSAKVILDNTKIWRRLKSTVLKFRNRASSRAKL